MSKYIVTHWSVYWADEAEFFNLFIGEVSHPFDFFWHLYEDAVTEKAEASKVTIDNIKPEYKYLTEVILSLSADVQKEAIWLCSKEAEAQEMMVIVGSNQDVSINVGEEFAWCVKQFENTKVSEEDFNVISKVIGKGHFH